MISGIDLNKTVDYTCKSDTDNPTIWKLGIIPSRILGQLSMGVSGSEIEMAYKLLQLTIRGWENFNIEFTTVKENMFGKDMEVVPVSILERIPLQTITELSQKSLGINGLTRTEAKN